MHKAYIKMNKELPKIDLPEEWMIGTGINKELLSLYTNFPCRIKSEIFVLCMDGVLEASVNLNRITVRANDFVTIMPGSILQIHSVDGEPILYFGGFSSKYIEQANLNRSAFNTLLITSGKPIISLNPDGAKLLEEYFIFLIKLYTFFNESTRKGITPHLYNNIHIGIAAMYNNRAQDSEDHLTKNQMINKSFTQLVMQNYNRIRNVTWYAEKLEITPAYLCTIVKQVTGNTCMDIISRMVIMDAKSQLKSTNLSVQEIADSLNFTNMSFFGKYFKRYVGMSPLSYRYSG